ncbi:MAG: GNAT family protein [Clostridium sp.]|uniref:GNAT family N-acetyltransferase n=1 Tax=Clostridium sp. TaxID=1506 RepID=UPI00290D96D5|nr:GNAT family protein [Clostridium sp.]MDU7337443.1 GNAT family protein [Clostridium sp.]
MESTIRTWKLSDAPDLATALNNPNILKNLRDGLPYPYTISDAESFIHAMLGAEPGSQYAFTIDVSGKAVGSIAVFRQANIHFRTAELGYYVAEPYWGQGLGTDAVRQICNYVFQKSDILRIFAEPFAYNTASCRILEKAGFTSEGILRKNAVKNGEVLDMKLYSLVKE